MYDRAKDKVHPRVKREELKGAVTVAVEMVLWVSFTMVGQKIWRKGSARGCRNERPIRVRSLNRDELKSWFRDDSLKQAQCLAKREICASAHKACEES